MREQRTIRVKDEKTTIFDTLYEGDKIVDASNGNTWIVKQDEIVKSGNSILSLTILSEELIEPHSGSGGGIVPSFINPEVEILTRDQIVKGIKTVLAGQGFPRINSNSFWRYDQRLLMESPVTRRPLELYYESMGSTDETGPFRISYSVPLVAQ